MSNPELSKEEIANLRESSVVEVPKAAEVPEEEKKDGE